MRKLMQVLAVAAVCTVFTGCSGTLPLDSYMPQNLARYKYKNSVDIDVFTYEPARRKNIRANQIENTAAGSFYVNTDIAEMVRRATVLELEKTGVPVNVASDIVIGGDVLELKADDLGFNVHWTYSIRYRIFRKKDQRPLFAKEYSPPMKKTEKFMPLQALSSTIYDLVSSGYEMFIRDEGVRAILDVPAKK